MRKEHKELNGIECKECPKCKRWLPLCEYSLDNSNWDGLHGYCKSCTNDINRKIYSNNSDAKRKKMHEYRHRQGLKATANKTCRITIEIINAVMDKYGYCCAYCGCDCSTEYEIDHKIPLSRNGTNDFSNLALSCPHCNRSKRNKTDDEYCGRRV